MNFAKGRLTMAESVRKSCIGCGHHRHLTADENGYACHYILDTGYSRGCPASKCPYYTIEPCHIIDDFRYPKNVETV